MKKQFVAIVACALVVFFACKRENATSGAADTPGGGAHGHTATEPYNDSLNKPGVATDPSATNTNLTKPTSSP